ncbi:MAG: aminotransferase class III-fold pyridoxal phosphate-dependent enzyme, partial [Trueperaceae bacterium]|nr:aminotransferase class III-fold pyridoxal phosphate-dependent enzyme [Trueperaceae bacterium]
IKLARQYHVAKGESSRYRILSRFPSYHGSTLGALSATGYLTLNQPFEPLLYEQQHIPAPTCYRCPYNKSYPDCGVACAEELETLIQNLGPETVAAFMLEPIGGASTAAIVPPDDYFGIITQICRKYGILLIYDEVMTGVSRTGKFCAYQHWPEAEVDILVLAKGLGAGYSPLGAVVCRPEISDAVLAAGGFRHGYTYAGNPLSCAVGLEALKIIDDEQLCENATLQGNRLKEGLQQLQSNYSFIGDVRGKGLLLGVEVVADREMKEPFPASWDVYQVITRFAFEEGLIIYPRRNFAGIKGDHVLIAPPLIITGDEVEALLERFEKALKKLEDWINSPHTNP